MKKNIFKTSNSIKEQKKLYLFLIGLAITSIILGIIFIFLMDNSNTTYIQEYITSFFNNLKESNNNQLFFQAFLNNLFYILIIWLFGLSIIGIPIVIFIFLFKNFIVGFSLSSIISTYKLEGLLKALIQLFPHQLIFLIVLLLLTFYSVSFSVKLFHYLFLKKSINFKDATNKYLKILLISIIISFLISLYEGYIATYFLLLLNN